MALRGIIVRQAQEQSEVLPMEMVNLSLLDTVERLSHPHPALAGQLPVCPDLLPGIK